MEAEVLIKSKRRCSLCYGLNNDLEEKAGQIAHLDKNRDNHSIDNLAFYVLFIMTNMILEQVKVKTILFLKLKNIGKNSITIIHPYTKSISVRMITMDI